VADGQIIAALVTAVASGGAAFLGVRAANRNVSVVDERAKATAEWERIHQLVDMAISNDPIKSYVGMELLINSKADWNGNPEQRTFIKHALEALNAPAIQAYRPGKTSVVTSPLVSSPAGPMGVKP
jgi:hypothetical protein